MSPELEHARYLCIGCPLGCRLEVDAVEGEVVEVRGHSCRRGKEFAVQEHTDPRRFVTTTVRVRGGRGARLPVATAASVPKGRVADVARALHALTLDAPVAMGDVVLADVLGTGVDVVATRDLPARGGPRAADRAQPTAPEGQVTSTGTCAVRNTRSRTPPSTVSSHRA